MVECTSINVITDHDSLTTTLGKIIVCVLVVAWEPKFYR